MLVLLYILQKEFSEKYGKIYLVSPNNLNGKIIIAHCEHKKSQQLIGKLSNTSCFLMLKCFKKLLMLNIKSYRNK
jgi:hypothetical protein